MATINYLYPVAGAVPSQKASSTVSYVNAQLITSIADTTIVVTHNFNLSATEQTQGFGLARIQWSTPPTTNAGALGFVVTTNIVTITQAGGTGAAGTGILYIERPYTPTR